MSDRPDSTDSGYYGLHNMNDPALNTEKQPISMASADPVAMKREIAAFTCRECGQYVTDQRVITMGTGQFWHQQCLRCSLCRTGLGDFETCFMRDQNVYCKICYGSAYAAYCSACRYPVAAGDWVRRVRGYAYHLGCFTCDQCRKSLSTGESFLMIGHQIICENHMIKTGEPEPAVIQETPPVESRLGAIKSENVPTTCTSSSEDAIHSTEGSPKRKRARTNFTAQQLEILQSSFSLNENPDTVRMQGIADMAGLSKKVTQVWFQNRRSRLKKIGAISTAKPSTTNVTMGDFGMAQILNGTQTVAPMNIKYESLPHMAYYS